MARKLRVDVDGAEEPRRFEDNSKLRGEMIRDALTETYDLDKQIAALQAQHLETPREKKSKIKKKLREHLKITAPVFQAVYVRYRMTRDAEAAEDSATLDTLREMAVAAGRGVTVDMVEAIETEDAKKAADKAETAGDFQEDPAPSEESPAPSEQVLADLRENGRNASKMGRGTETNPHNVNTHAGAAWHDGWLKDQRRIANGPVDGNGKGEAVA